MILWATILHQITGQWPGSTHATVISPIHRDYDRCIVWHGDWEYVIWATKDEEL